MVLFSSYTAKSQPLTDVNYVTSYGQSLSVGWNSKPVISTTQPYNNIMFKGGVRPYETGGDRSEFVPLIESLSEDTWRGESPIAGTFDYFTKIYGKEKGVRFLGSVNGVGGISITGLAKNTEPFMRIKNDLVAGKKLCDEKKESFSMPFFVWTQGETDQMNKQTQEWYIDKMLTLINDVDILAKSITGQTNRVLCLGYQVSTHLNYFKSNPTDYPSIALAQLKMALDDSSGYVMTTPLYPFNYSDDGVHLSAEASKLYGAYVGYVAKKVLVEGKKWKPIHPTNYKVTSKNGKWALQIEFYTPVPPLVIDTTVVTNPGNFGFTLVKGSGEKIGIKSIKVLNKTSIILDLEEPPINAKLCYGMTHKEFQKSSYNSGARGCLRDSQGEKVRETILTKEYKMHNWLPFFELEIN